MILQRFYDEQLAQASYLIGCPSTGVAAVIDPNRAVDQYITAAEGAGLRITDVLETHIHADFVSGLRELAARTGATMHLSACGGAAWQYEFRHEPRVALLADRAVIRVGHVQLEAVHTPGHTPEHLSFLVTDRASADEPMGIVTGDFVFVNDVGRPDLLETAAGVAGSADVGARQLFRSLAWFRTLPDHLQIWPGHGAGSACGKGMSAVPQSTVGYERRHNWAFGAESEAMFVTQVLAGQPEPPAYFAEMKRVNRVGPPVLGGLAVPERLAEHQISALLASGDVVVDTRPAADFAARHIPGTLSIPFNKSFLTWAGALLPYDREIFLLVDATRPEQLADVLRNLMLIGHDGVRGWFGTEAIGLWETDGHALERVEQLGVAELATSGKGRIVLDVRGKSEWESGHIEGALHIPLAELPARMGEIPEDQPVAVHCQGGGRSAIAASLLQARGRTDVANVAGGFGAWVQAGFPVAR